MSMFKKNPKGGNTYVDGFGKTEPVGGTVFTENLNPGGGNFGVITPTVPGEGNLFDSNNPGNTIPPDGIEIEGYNHTVPNYVINTDTLEKVAPVVGWLVCIKGPNQGKEFRIHSDYNYVGSQKGDIIIPGDQKISREKHMIITFDPIDRSFYVAPASGANIIRLNDKALIGGGQKLNNYDVIKTGDSSFMFIGFCGENFGWESVLDE